MYGNIGSDTRLDFTVIGPAVNLTSRIDSMSKDLDRSLLLSGEFVRVSGIKAEVLGEFVLKGVGAKQPIYAVAEKSSPFARKSAKNRRRCTAQRGLRRLHEPHDTADPILLKLV